MYRWLLIGNLFLTAKFRLCIPQHRQPQRRPLGNCDGDFRNALIDDGGNGRPTDGRHSCRGLGDGWGHRGPCFPSVQWMHFLLYLCPEDRSLLLRAIRVSSCTVTFPLTSHVCGLLASVRSAHIITHLLYFLLLLPRLLFTHSNHRLMPRLLTCRRWRRRK